MTNRRNYINSMLFILMAPQLRLSGADNLISSACDVLELIPCKNVYLQTGSGKTYTMGTGFEVDCLPAQQGIIPRAVQHLFNEIDRRRQEALARGEPPPDFKVNAQFMEVSKTFITSSLHQVVSFILETRV